MPKNFFLMLYILGGANIETTKPFVADLQVNNSEIGGNAEIYTTCLPEMCSFACTSLGKHFVKYTRLGVMHSCCKFAA